MLADSSMAVLILEMLAAELKGGDVWGSVTELAVLDSTRLTASKTIDGVSPDLIGASLSVKGVLLGTGMAGRESTLEKDEEVSLPLLNTRGRSPEEGES